jgi:hypothetical protein
MPSVQTSTITCEDFFQCTVALVAKYMLLDYLIRSLDKKIHTLL